MSENKRYEVAKQISSLSVRYIWSQYLAKYIICKSIVYKAREFILGSSVTLSQDKQYSWEMQWYARVNV